MLSFFSIISDMSKEARILVAGSLGIIVGLTIFGLKQFLKKKSKEYDDYYADFHRHFEIIKKEEAEDGVEFMAVR